jgi:integrase
MGISKIGPKHFFIKARVKIRPADPRLPVDDRRAQLHFHGTEAQARDKYLAMKSELRGERPKANTFGDLLLGYRDRRGDIPRTERSVYDSLMRDLGAVENTRLKAALQAYAGILRRTISQTTGKVLSNGSINRRRAMVATVLRQAKELGDILENPLTRVLWPKLKEIPRDRRLTPEETARLMAVVIQYRPWLRFIFWYALRVPCRKAELVDMQKPALDLFNNMIRVYNGETKNDEGTWKPIPEEMISYFRSIPADCPYLFYRMGRGKKAGQYLRLGDFKRAWGWCLRKAGIHNFRFHDTRHISARNLVLAGMSEREVMDIAGWSTNMLSTYWGSSGTESAARAKFLPAECLTGGNEGATAPEESGKSAEIRAERAVS